MSFNPDGGCSNRECLCRKPENWPTCKKFIHYFTNYCARCGWERHDNHRRSLIHNGGKP